MFLLPEIVKLNNLTIKLKLIRYFHSLLILNHLINPMNILLKMYDPFVKTINGYCQLRLAIYVQVTQVGA